MSILDQIVAAKKKEVKRLKTSCPISVLEKSDFFQEKTRSLKEHLLSLDSFGIISEFKRKSPSAGIINETAVAWEVGIKYSEAGASAISVLTDTDFFGGSSNDLTEISKRVECPVLRKDFIIDEYQIIEARSIGADAILLIAEIHTGEKLSELHRFAHSIGLEVLVEIHDEKRISHIPDDAEIVGINSRNLASFSVDQGHLPGLIGKLPKNVVKIAESGINSVNDYLILKNAGFDGFLIGGYFMRTPDPGKTCKLFIDVIRESLNSAAIKGNYFR
jgi:indole-3-glycerol phosphate synthase